MVLTRRQARQFLLLKQGLLGDYRFIGKEGALKYVKAAGCIQFDPVDVCGKNAELTLASRVKGFRKDILQKLLYQDRLLSDYPDKNQSIIMTEDWPCFSRFRNAAKKSGESFEGLELLEGEALGYIDKHGPVSSDELPIKGSIFWHSAIHWSGNWAGETKAARAVLEQLYSTGKLVIYKKQGSRKYYDIAEKYLAPALLSAADPYSDEFEHIKWRMLRRIGAVGMMWNRPSDAWLNIWRLDSETRGRAFKELLQEGHILEASVEGVKVPLYYRMEDQGLMNEVLSGASYRPRCELIAPLDCLMWDRKLIRALFDFDYTWEIYTPAAQRKYGYYVLPLVYGEGFIGRVEAASDTKNKILTVKNVWLEKNIKDSKRLQGALDRCLGRFARFNECDAIVRL